MDAGGVADTGDFDVMIEDGQLHELFDSRTGEGMGNVQQGWTAAVFLRMQQELG